MSALKEQLIHRWLAIPYILHSEVKEPTTKKAPTILFIHGIGSTGESWRQVIERLPASYRIVSIDLLGFGNSAKPTWARYDAKLQARSVIATYLRLRIRGKVTIVGHSLGALVAVEFAKRYPLLVKSLILCSPPFYKLDDTKKRLVPTSDTLLRDLYLLAKKHPDQLIKMSALALKLGLVNKSFTLSSETAPVYMNALESSIINQTSLHDAINLKVPTRIIRGTLDPVVVSKNLRFLAKQNKHIRVTSVLASHEVIGPFVKAVVRAIKELV